MRQSIMAVVTARFSDLLDLARVRVERVQGEEQLREILILLVTIPTEGEAHRSLLSASYRARKPGAPPLRRPPTPDS